MASMAFRGRELLWGCPCNNLPGMARAASSVERMLVQTWSALEMETTSILREEALAYQHDGFDAASA